MDIRLDRVRGRVKSGINVKDSNIMTDKLTDWRTSAAARQEQTREDMGDLLEMKHSVDVAEGCNRMVC